MADFVKFLSPTALLDICLNNIVTLVIFVFVFYLTWKFLTRSRNLPPGPWGLPVIGYLPFMESNLSKSAISLGKKYKSDVVTFKIFHRRFTFLNTLDLVKEHLLKKDHFTDRPGDGGLLEVFNPGHKGLLNSSGAVWKEHRRFALSVLRDFGMGKIAVEEKVIDELQGTLEEMEKTEGQPINPQNLAMGAASNIVCNIIFGERFHYKDPIFIKYLHAINNIANSGQTDPDGRIRIFFSWMRFIPFDVFGYFAVKDSFNTLTEFTNEQIAKHKAQLNPSHVSDYIDAYLLRLREETELATTFTGFQLTCEIIDLFFAGTETTSTTLRWAIYYMAKYPEIQEKVQSEIDSQIGRDRMPVMKDRLLLPYSEAVLLEIQRMATILTLGVLHSNNERDVEIEGFTIPRETRVCANLNAIHHDPKTWPYPDTFNPENFLDGDGKLRNQDKSIPFLIGRRSCAGEALAKMELFMFFIGWLQKFTIRCPAGQTMPEGRTESLIKQPKEHKVCFIPR